jgi:hypothetical protein
VTVECRQNTITLIHSTINPEIFVSFKMKSFLTLAFLAVASISGVAANVGLLPMGVEVLEVNGMTTVREVVSVSTRISRIH